MYLVVPYLGSIAQLREGQPAEVTSPRRLLTEPVGRRYLATLAQLELNGKLPEGMPQSVVVVGPTTTSTRSSGRSRRERRRRR